MSPTTGDRGVRGLVFRIGFLYWMAVCLTTLLTNTSPFDQMLTPIENAIWSAFAWIGHHVLGIEGEIGTATTGSGDRTVNWIWLLCVAVLAVVGGVAWALLDRRRAHDARLREVLRIVMRYTLAFTMLGYGLAKVFPLQFGPLEPPRLAQTFGEASPMGLLWSFMGASTAYTFLAGAAETLGALLLLFRRTTLIGALVLVGVMTNVVMLNFCYDVCVKITSAHYLAMAIYLVLPDVGRLINVAYLNRVAQPRVQDLALSRRGQLVRRVLKYGTIAAILIWSLVQDRAAMIKYSEPGPAAWFDGAWEVTAFQRDGRDVPASRRETGRLRRLRFFWWQDQWFARWRTYDAVPTGPTYIVVDDTHALTFTPDPDNKVFGAPGKFTLTYRRSDADHVELDGTLGAAHVTVQLERVTSNGAVLTSRGFHWISEQPFSL